MSAKIVFFHCSLPSGTYQLLKRKAGRNKKISGLNYVPIDSIKPVRYY